jgi:hypothetical protein
MKCPKCGEHSQDAWQPLQTMLPRKVMPLVGEVGLGEMFEQALPISDDTGREFLKLDWMRCGDEACMQTVVRCHETTVRWAGHVPIQHTETRFLYPSSSTRDSAPPEVPESMRRDYDEAGAILDLSHRMSAVLARKVVSDILKKYANRDENRLTNQIDKFLEQAGLPSAISSGLHHVREAADMSAHTQEEETDDGRAVIDIDREEAEWTLDFVQRLFDYLIIQPARDDAIKARIEDKSARAGRRPFGRRGQDKD